MGRAAQLKTMFQVPDDRFLHIQVGYLPICLFLVLLVVSFRETNRCYIYLLVFTGSNLCQVRRMGRIGKALESQESPFYRLRCNIRVVFHLRL